MRARLFSIRSVDGASMLHVEAQREASLPDAPPAERRRRPSPQREDVAFGSKRFE